MKNSLRKFISISVVFAILFVISVPAFAQFSDTNGHWAVTAINKWVEKGIINGNPNGTYAPDKAVSRAEFASMLCKLFNYSEKSSSKFSDVSDTAWYADAVSKTAAAGVIVGNGGQFKPTAPISRQEAAVMLYRAFMLNVREIAAVNRYVDVKDIASWAKDAISAVSEKGFMSGWPGNKFAPKANVTRAEAVKMIDNAIQELKNTAGTYTGTIDKNLMVNTKDVILKNMVINGDLFLAPGIGDGNVTLDNVKVKGKTVVMGGGENSIHLTNTTLTGTLVIIKKDGKIRIVAEGSTVVSNVQLNSGAKLEESNLTGSGFGDVEILTVGPGQTITLDGDFAEVSVEAAGAAVQIADGKVGSLVVATGVTNTSVQIAAGAAVTTFTANSAVQVTGQGTITTANINAPGVVIAQKPTNVNVGSGLTATVGGTQTSGNTTNPPPTTSGNSNNNNNNNNPGDTGGTITSIGLTKVGGGTINASSSGTTYTVDLSSVEGNVFIEGLEIVSSPVANALVASDVDKTAVGSNGVFSFSPGYQSLATLYFGEAAASFDGNVSVATLKKLFTGSITRDFTVKNGSTTIKTIKLVIKVSAGETLGDNDNILNCYTISSAGTTVTATLKTGNQYQNQKVLTGTNFYQTLQSMITVPAGYVYSGVEVGINKANYTEITNKSVDILANLLAQVNNVINPDKNIDEITLSDLKEAGITAKVTAVAPGNANIVATVLFK